MNNTSVVKLDKTIDLMDILEGKRTYPSWSTGQTYPLIIENQNLDVIVSYQHKGNKKPTRTFPRYIEITQKLLWFFGFIYGEGSKSKGSSAYRRFTITNSDSKPMRLALDVLEEIQFLSREHIPIRSIKIARSKSHNDKELLEFWKNELKVTSDKFYMAPKYDENKKTKYGVCHIFISDVLLRRVMDEIAEFIFNGIK